MQRKYLTALKLTHWFFALFPVAWFALVYSYAIRARYVLGYWPQPFHPDPKTDLLWNTIGGHFIFSWYVLLTTPIAAILFTLMVPVLYSREPRKPLLLRCLVGLTIFAFSFIWLKWGPDSIIDWYFD